MVHPLDELGDLALLMDLYRAVLDGVDDELHALGEKQPGLVADDDAFGSALPLSLAVGLALKDSLSNFAAGVMLYEFIANERFYEGMTAQEIWQVVGRGGFRPRKWGEVDEELREVARQLGVDLSQVSASGRKGRILREDVVAYFKGSSAPAPAAAPAGRCGAGGWPMRLPERFAVGVGDGGLVGVNLMGEVGDVVGPLDSPVGPALFRVNGKLPAQETAFEPALVSAENYPALLASRRKATHPSARTIMLELKE